MSYLRQQLKEVVHYLLEQEWKDRWVKTETAADILRVHPQTIRSWAKQGKLRCRGTGTLYFEMRDLLEFHHNN